MGPGDREIADYVRHLGRLDQKSVCRLEGFVNVPDRASAAVAGELKSRGAVPLGDVAAPVDPQEIHRNAFMTGPLQRRQPLADLFHADVEAGREPLHVMANAARFFQERAVGHQQRPGKIIGERRAADLGGVRARRLDRRPCVHPPRVRAICADP